MHPRHLLAALLLAAGLFTRADLPATLVFAVRPVPPYMEPTPNGYRGSHIEIMGVLAKRLGVKLVLRECPTLRCLRMLEEGSSDVSMGYAREPTREAYLYFVNPAYASPTRTVFYLRQDEVRPLEKLTDLYEFRVGLVHGVFYTDALAQIPEYQRDYAPDMESNFRKLLAGHVDVVPVGINVGSRLVEKLNLGKRMKLASYHLVVDTERQIALSRKSAWYAQRSQLEREFGTMVRSGQVQAILARYETALPSSQP